MSPLERRYRRMLCLLPADHRATRGEELLGLLLDLDEGRDRPSPRQGIGVLGLALRLRLLPAASLLLAAYLIADSTSIAELVYQMVTGSAQITVGDAFPIDSVAVVLLVVTLPQLGAAVAWILGARRTAVACTAAVIVLQMRPSVLDGLRLHDLTVLAVLAVATRWHWPAPRPRAMLLTATALAFPLWTLVAIWNGRGIPYATGHPPLALAPAAVGAMLGALVAGAVTRRRPRPAVITIAIIGALAGAALPTALPRLLYHSTDGWLLCVTACIALLAAVASPPSSPHPDSADQPARPASAST